MQFVYCSLDGSCLTETRITQGILTSSSEIFRYFAFASFGFTLKHTAYRVFWLWTHILFADHSSCLLAQRAEGYSHEKWASKWSDDALIVYSRMRLFALLSD